MKEELKKAFAEYISKKGIKMTKKISSGGFMSSATYDNRTVFSLEKLASYSQEGFSLDQDAGTFLFNFIWNL